MQNFQKYIFRRSEKVGLIMHFSKIILILIIFTSCTENIQESEQENSQQQSQITETNKSVPLDSKDIEKETRYVSKDTIIENFTPEIRVNSIELLNYKSTESLNKDLTTVENHEESFPHVDFSNNSNTEKLRLIFHYGGRKNAFSEIEVSYGSIKNEKNILEIESFQSGRGIKLGMSSEEVEKILGKANIIFEDKIRYRIVDEDLSISEFLGEYNYPSYYIDAKFVDNKLVKYRFGFDYP